MGSTATTASSTTAATAAATAGGDAAVAAREDVSGTKASAVAADATCLIAVTWFDVVRGDRGL